MSWTLTSLRSASCRLTQNSDRAGGKEGAPVTPGKRPGDGHEETLIHYHRLISVPCNWSGRFAGVGSSVIVGQQCLDQVDRFREQFRSNQVAGSPWQAVEGGMDEGQIVLIVAESGRELGHVADDLGAQLRAGTLPAGMQGQ